jgi:tetratricopeptide (TPR) repeat protein
VVSLNPETRESSSSAEEKSLKEIADREPANFDVNHRLGKLLVDNGRSREALPYLERASQLKADDYTNSYELALAYADSGQYERARTETRALLGRRDTPELHHLLADVQEKLGEPLDAVREYQRAAELSPSESNLFDWGAELLVHRAIQPAIEVYKRGNHLFPRSSRMLAGLGVSWYAAGFYDKAVENLCQASDLRPDDPTPYLFLGKMQSVDTSQTEALGQRLARFAKLQPGNALANYYYALSLWKRRNGPRDTESAIKVESLLTEAVRLDPKLASGYMHLGILYADREDFSKAISAYRRAIEVDPQLEEAHFRLAQAYRQTGEESKAREELRLFEQISKKTAEQIDRQRRELPQFVYTLRGQPPQ